MVLTGVVREAGTRASAIGKTRAAAVVQVGAAVVVWTGVVAAVVGPAAVLETGSAAAVAMIETLDAALLAEETRVAAEAVVTMDTGA